MRMPIVYPGVSDPINARFVPRCMISINRLLRRRSDFPVVSWILDSGAFTRISSGKSHVPVNEYARQANMWASCGHLQAVVSQDYMCEPFVLKVTGRTVREHQRMSTNRYMLLLPKVEPYLMPVLQGSTPHDYARHARELSPYIEPNAWVGVGSVCKRQGKPEELAHLLEAILDVRADFRLHGFGVKTTSLRSKRVAECLYSTDSMAWKIAAFREGRDHNGGSEAYHWLKEIEAIRPHA